MGTICGGVTSLALKILILAYFCMRTIHVINYEDLTITSYSVIVDRSQMVDPINFGEYGQQLAFGLFDNLTGLPKYIDPRLGKFVVS